VDKKQDDREFVSRHFTFITKLVVHHIWTVNLAVENIPTAVSWRIQNVIFRKNCYRIWWNYPHIPEVKKGQSCPCNRSCTPMGLWDVEGPTFSTQSTLRWRWGCQDYAPSYPCNRAWRPIPLSDVEVPTFSRQSAHKWRWGYQPYAPSYPWNRPWRPIGLWDVKVPTSLDNRLTDGGKVVSFMRRPPLYPQGNSWYSFLLEAQSTPRAMMRLEGLGQLKNPMTFSGSIPRLSGL
jgi:hypothetical protein